MAAAFSRLSVSIVAKPTGDNSGKDVTGVATSGTFHTQQTHQQDPQSYNSQMRFTPQQQTNSVLKQCSAPRSVSSSSVSITRFETVRSDLAQTIAKMLVVGKELKDLAGNEIMDSPDTAKEVSVNFAMWRVYELAQPLEEEA